MTRPLLFSVLLLSAAISKAQDHDHSRCTATRITERFLQQQGLKPDIRKALPDLAIDPRAGQTLTVTVVVHVVYNTPAENVPSSAIQAMIDQMNADFSQSNPDISGVRPTFNSSIGNPDIQFCLAQVDPLGNPTTGITRTPTSDTWFDPDTQTDAMKSPPLGISAWNPSQYLNIWICDISSGATGGQITLGYAYLPVGGVVGTNIDGLVIDYQYGLPAGARTATHEIGHYLGLEHPWGDGGCGTDDGFTDTPNTDTPTFSCANTSLMKCGVLTQYENFMDYSNCSVMYTNQQSSYMRSILQGVRASLLNSTACGDPNPGTLCIPTSEVGTGEGDFINSVTLGTIVNTNSGGVGGPTYNDYTGLYNASLQQGSTHTITIQGGNYAPNSYAAWIDFDQNGTLSSGEKLGEFSTTMSGETGTIDFTVPVGALTGTTVLRVRGVYLDQGEPAPADPCFNYTYGETEDYGIMITSSGGGGYCIPTSQEGTTDGDYINTVMLNTLSNTNSGSTGGASYNDLTAMSTTIYRNNSYSLFIESGAYQTDNFAAWIDHDQNNSFSSDEKLGEFTTTAPYEMQMIQFTVPNTAHLGVTRLRIRGVYHLENEPSPTDPCFDYVYGETEDYSVNISVSSQVLDTDAAGITIFPNPTQGLVNIHLPGDGPATIMLLDVQGRLVSSQRSTSDQVIMGLENVASGQYLLRIEQNAIVTNHRLVVAPDR